MDSDKTMYEFSLYKIEKVKSSPNKSTGKLGPNSRSGHRCVVDKANLYSFGGYNPCLSAEEQSSVEDGNWSVLCPLFRELWKFNFATRCWTKIKTKGHTPKELASHAALLNGRFLMVFGGTGVPFGVSSSNSLHLCDLTTYEWQMVKVAGDIPQKQYGQAIALNDGSLYVIGGTTGYDYSIDVHCLDLKTFEWSELVTTGQPRERYRHEVATYDGKIFVFGGGTAAESVSLSEIAAFDIKSKCWERITTFPDVSQGNTERKGMTPEGYPSARRCHSLVQKDNDVFIAGGYNGEEIFPDIWKLSLRDFVWTRLPSDLPQPVYFHSAAITEDGKMYVFGGVKHIQENTRTAEVYSVWLSIPKLKAMCWEALLTSVPNIANLSRSMLLEMGIPLEFVNITDHQAACG